MANILICDDERDIVNALKIYLSDPDYTLFEAGNGQEALEVLRDNEIHLILMDIMMPVMDGMTAMAKIRETSNVPIILLTAKSEDADKILGLNVGADDYITKPFNVLELKARVRALLRRSGASAAPEQGGALLKSGTLTLDPERRAAWRAGEEIDLTVKEFDLLELLMRNPGKVYSREALLNTVWGYDYQGEERTVDVHIRRLREKLEPDPANPTFIVTKWGVGYYLKG